MKTNVITNGKNLDAITNDNLWSIDWAKAERAAFLQAIPRSRLHKERELTPGVSARGVWMTDLSAMDRRSIKAQLAGRGDGRAAWWQLNCLLHRLLRPHSSLEWAMYSFHVRHHFLTRTRLQLAHDYCQVMQAIRRYGIVAGVHVGWKQRFQIRDGPL